MGHRSTELAKTVSGFTTGLEGRSGRRSPRPVVVGLVVMLMVSALANVEYGAAASDDTETHFIAATDLDGDSVDEVLTVTRSSDGSTGALEARIASNGSVIWSHVVVGTVGRVRVVDVFGDGLPEVAFVHHSSEQDSLGVVRYTGGRLGVTVIDGATGEQIWRFDNDVAPPDYEYVIVHDRRLDASCSRGPRLRAPHDDGCRRRWTPRPSSLIRFRGEGKRLCPTDLWRDKFSHERCLDSFGSQRDPDKKNSARQRRDHYACW